MSDAVIVRREGDCHRLTLNHPARGNALSPVMVQALAQALRSAADDGVALVVLTGAGRHFCTGLDLSDIDTVDEAELPGRFLAIEQLLQGLWAAPFLTLAVGHGRAIGAGADLFTACNHRLAAPDSRYRFPGAAFGLVLGTRRLGLRVGPDRAMDLVLSGRDVDATEALSLGLATELTETGEPEARIAAVLETARRCPRETVPAIKRAAYGDYAGCDADLAALAASAGRPGLKARILAHKAGVGRG